MIIKEVVSISLAIYIHSDTTTCNMSTHVNLDSDYELLNCMLMLHGAVPVYVISTFLPVFTLS